MYRGVVGVFGLEFITLIHQNFEAWCLRGLGIGHSIEAQIINASQSKIEHWCQGPCLFLCVLGLAWSLVYVSISFKFVMCILFSGIFLDYHSHCPLTMAASVRIFKIWTTKLHKFECMLQHGSHVDCVQFYSKISFQNKLFILLFFNVLTDLLLMLQGKQG